MKIETFEDRTISIIPENDQDRAWILMFCKRIKDRGGGGGLDYEITYSNDNGGGYSDVDEYLDKNEKGEFKAPSLDWEDLKCLEIHSFDL